MTEESTNGESEGEPRNDKSKESKQKDWVTQILRIVSIISAGVGLVILLWFVSLLGKEYTVLGSNKILLEKTAQVGDFIGGLVGSIWAFTGVLLFYLALRLQRKEFELQRDELKNNRKELENHRREFEFNRTTDIIYRQIERIDRSIDSFEYVHKVYKNSNYHDVPLIGKSALQQVCEDLNFIKTYLRQATVGNSFSKDALECVNLLREQKIYEIRLHNFLVAILGQIGLINDMLSPLEKSTQKELKKILIYNFETNLKIIISGIHLVSKQEILFSPPNYFEDYLSKTMPPLGERANELLEAIDKFDEGAKERILAIG